MARLVEITQPSDFVSCDQKGRATVAFSISNIRDEAIQVGAKVLVDEPTKEEWLEIAGGPEWDLGTNATDQITVKIQAPDDAKAGQYTFRLLVYSIDEPGEDFTKGEPVSFEVKEKPVPQPPPEKPFPVWIVVAVLCVLAIGGGVWYLLREKPPEPVMVVLPNVEKISFANAYQKLTSARLKVGKVDSVINRELAEDFVVKQQPHPDDLKEVEEGSEIDLTVAKRIRIRPEILKDRLLKDIRAVEPKPIAPVSPQIIDRNAIILRRGADETEQ